MYYLTVVKDGDDIVTKKQFDDYSTAIDFISQYYKPKSKRCVLTFTTEAINGRFARSIAFLTKSQDITKSERYFAARYQRAVEQETAFSFDASYIFRIESDAGIEDVSMMQCEQEMD